MRRQVTIGGLVALALLSGSVVAFAQQAPPPPGECAPVAAASEPADGAGSEQLDGTQPGLVPSARPATGQDEPEDEEPEDGEPADDDEPADDEPADDEPADDEPADDEPADDEPADDEPADDEPADDEPADDEEPSGATPTEDEPSDEEPADADEEPTDADQPSDQNAADEEEGPADDAAEPTDETSGDDAEGPTAGGAATPALDACGALDATAAAAFDWGTPEWADEFDGPLDETAWQVYTGTGFDGRGTRTADALTVDDGLLTITGDAEGATGGMSAQPGQRYGRWEARVRAPESDESYNPVLLLWPDDDAAAGSEVDFMEMLDPTRQTTSAFVHHGAENEQVMGEVAVDGTQWHNWAVEWTPTSVTTYVDGVEWWRVDDPALLPQGPMHLCVQLDWFPTGDAESQEASMEVDWVRQYAVDPEPTEEPAADEPVDDPAADEPTDPPADDPPADEPTADDPPADEPTDSPADEPGAEPAEESGDEPADDRAEEPGDGESEGASADLSEGAPDLATARPGLVERATPAARRSSTAG